MSIQNKNLIRSLSAALIAVGAMLPLHSASAAVQPSTATSENWSETWKRAKFPFLYHAATTQAASSDALVQRDILETWKRAKYPWLYTTSTSQTEHAATTTPAPGSVEAWRAAKFPNLRPVSAVVR